MNIGIVKINYVKAHTDMQDLGSKNQDSLVKADFLSFTTHSAIANILKNYLVDIR